MTTTARITAGARLPVSRLVFACIAAVCLIGVTASTGAAESLQIVSIDTNRILQQHPAFQEAQEAFQGEMQQMEQQLQDMGEEEQRMAQQMMQQQLQQRGQELQMEALDKVRADIEKIAEEKGYAYVVDANALIAGGKDITEEVMAEMELGE